MKNLEDLFKVEVGRVRTIEEVRAMTEMLQPHVDAYEASFNEACAMPWEGDDSMAGKRGMAFEKHDEEFPEGCGHSIALAGLREILEDLEMLEKVIPEDAPCAVVQEAVRSVTLKAAEGHTRNARHWLGMFGSDSYIRIDVFSWVAGVEPNYNELENETEEERKMFEEQISSIVEGIKKFMTEADKKESIQ